MLPIGRVRKSAKKLKKGRCQTEGGKKKRGRGIGDLRVKE
jgi:hypothetical protein